MSSLLEQIDADAESRLTLPPGGDPPAEVDRYRKFLQTEYHRLKVRHRRGGSGREICQGHARVWDRIFGSLVRAGLSAGDENELTPEGRGGAPAPRTGEAAGAALALVAIGGYGRSELSPASVIRLLLLLAEAEADKRGRPLMLDWIESPTLADLFAGVRLVKGTVPECVEMANADPGFKAALIDARLIGGDAPLFARFQQAVQARCFQGQEAAFRAARRASQEARRAKYGAALSVQEPHVKNGCGGLRDLQDLLWLAWTRHGARTLAELEAQGLILEPERVELEAACDFLLRVRNQAHYQTGRAADALTKSLQPAVAHGLGYAERSLSRRLEQFMRDYYRQARSIELLTRSIGERLGLVSSPRHLAAPTPQTGARGLSSGYEVDGFQFTDEGPIRATTPAVFRQDPSRLMRVFRYAQQRGRELHPGLTQLIRQEVGRVGAAFRADARVHQTFLEILKQRGNVAAVLRAMHETGLLGAYLPAFGRLTCLVQHEFFHQYTADEHTLACLGKLDEIAATNDGPLAFYGDLLNKSVERPHLLYLALLLHDAGKVSATRHHAEEGARLAAAVAKRLGLEATSASTLCLLVRQHLTMVTVSQRRDLDEPAEIHRFAALVGNLDHLNLLTLVTIADSLGTSDQLWNGFKNTLLLNLYWRTREVLLGSAEFAQGESRRRERLVTEVRALLGPDFPADERAAHFDLMPARYFRVREAKTIAGELQLAHRFLARVVAEDEDPLEPVASWEEAADCGYSVVRVATWDRPGLFSRLCGALTAAGLNILSAEVFTRGDSIVLDTFTVVEATRGAPVEPEEQARFAHYLHQTVCAGVDPRTVIEARRPPLPLNAPAAYASLPTVIRFDNRSADTRTVLELEAQDRVGLLYAIAQALAALELDISVAKVCTERGAALDSFYLREADGSKIESPARQQEIEHRLRHAVAGVDPQRPAPAR